MVNPFDHFGGFLFAVYDHLFTLLAGCVLTVVIALISKHFIKRPLTLREDVAVFSLFLFFACFQAWHDQYVRANGIQAKLDAKPLPQSSVTVNLPPAPPPVVVVNSSERSVLMPQMPGNSMELESWQFSPEHSLIAAGSEIDFNIVFAQRGPAPIKNFISYISVASAANPSLRPDDRDALLAFRKDIPDQRKRYISNRNDNSQNVDIGGRTFFTNSVKIPNQEAADNLMSGKLRLYFFAWTAWTGESGKVVEQEYCYWLQQPVTTNMLERRNNVWHGCTRGR